VLRDGQGRWAVKRSALISLPLTALVIVGATLLVVAHGSGGRAVTLTAKVDEGPVSAMVKARGVVSAAKTANLSFQSANTVRVVDVKVGYKVKKGQKLAELNTGGARRAVLQAQGSLAQQQAALDLILNDVNAQGLRRIYERAKAVADQARKNIDLKESADSFVAKRQEHIVHLDEKAEDAAKDKLRSDGCLPNGKPSPPVLPMDLRTATCASDKSAVDAADLKRFNDVTTLVNARKNLRVNRGGLTSTYRSARQAAVTAYNTWSIARTNRPNQILAQRALVANALVSIASAQGMLANSYIYAPIDGTVSAITGAEGEFNSGGSNLTPNTPQAPGGSAKIPVTGDLAGLDQKNLTGGQGPNLGLQSVLPGGNTFIQLSDISVFSVVAVFPQDMASRINIDSQARVSFDVFPSTITNGTVTAVSPVGTPGAGGAPMYYATVLLDKDHLPAALKPGLTANVSVVTSTIENKAMVVPTSAVTEDGGQSFVQVPGPDGTPHKKPFTRGKVGDDNTQVLGGLRRGDTVLIPDTGALPVPANPSVPNVPTEHEINFQHVNPPAPEPKPQDAPLPSAPQAAEDTYPGDPGDLPDDPSSTGGTDGAGGDPTAGMGGVNPFAAPAAPPASPASGN
jgi:HlyD family secretion protein